MLLINIPTEARNRFNVSLEGITYRFTLDWNDVEETWYLGIFDINLNPIRTGIAVRHSAPLLRRWSLSELPPGELHFFSLETDRSFPRTGANTTWILMYFTEEEMEAAGV